MNPRGLLFITLFNSILGLSVLFPILAPLGRWLGFTELQVGSLSTSYALMQFLMSPYWGRRSERVGRRPVLLTGILGFALSFFAFAVIAQLGKNGVFGHWTTFGLLLASRLAGGAFSSATLPTAQAYIADTTDRADRTAGMAMIGAAFGLGVVIGPAIGAALSTLSLLAPVYFSAGFALLNALFVWLKLPEPKKHVAVPSEGHPTALIVRMWPVLALGFVISLSSVAMEQTVAFYFQDRLHLSEHQTARTVGLALVFYGIVAVFVQGFLVRRFKWPPHVLLNAGVPIALAGFVGLIFAHRFGPLTAALAVQGLGQGLALPGVTAASSLTVGEHEQGAAAGLNHSAHGLGRVLGPVVGTSLYTLRDDLPYYASALLLVLALGALWASPRIRRAVTHHADPGAA
ncbi:MAG: MFS transporter [Polyangiaceae bacterium]|nr:MFS transporter [Polyangiaceae bacterium]